MTIVGKLKLRVCGSGLKGKRLVSDVCKRGKQSSSVVLRRLISVSDTSHNIGNVFTMPSGKNGNKLSNDCDLHSTNGLEGSIIITKPRGVPRRQKLFHYFNSGREIVGAASSTRSAADLQSNQRSASRSHVRMPKRRLTEFNEDGSTDKVAFSGMGNSDNLNFVKTTKRRSQSRKGLVSSRGDVRRSNDLEGSIIVTKHPRGVTSRKKIGSDREIDGPSSSTRNVINQQDNKLSVSRPQIHKRKKLTDFKGVSKDNRSSCFIRNSACLDSAKATKRRFMGRKQQDLNLLGTKDFLVNSLGVVFPDDDEDNLEQNAARMLSSRFETSCAGISYTRVASSKPVKESSLLLSPRNLNGADANSTGRVLRPRKHGGRGFARKRRHFYEVCFNNMDPYWVVKQRIRVFWPLDKCWYFGLVKDYDPVTKMHHVKYDDRDEEWINLQNERFKLLLFPSEISSNFNHERPIEEVKFRGEEERKKSLNDLSTGSLVESEPIISWLTRSNRRKRPAPGFIKIQRRILPASNGFKAVGIPNIASSLSSSLLDEPAEDVSTQNRVFSNNRKLPFVYFRRRTRKDNGHLGNFVDRNFVHACSAEPISLLASLADTELALEELYISALPNFLSNAVLRLSTSIWSMCQSRPDSDNILMCRNFFLFNYKLIQLFPMVRMVVGFTDNLSLKLFLFEGCLSWAVALLCQTLRANFLNTNLCALSAENISLRKIRINMSNMHNNDQQYHLVVDGFMESDSRWRFLEKKLKKHCIRFKELSPSDCAYDSIRSLPKSRAGILAQLFKGNFPVEDIPKSKNKSYCIHVEESDQVSDITLENFASSSTTAADSKIFSFTHLRVDTEDPSLSNDGDCLKSSHDCLSIEVNGGACSVGHSGVRKNSRHGMSVSYHKLPKHTRSRQGSGNLCSLIPDDSSSPDKSEGGCISSSKTAGIQHLRGTRARKRTKFNRGAQDTHSTSNLHWEMNEDDIHSPDMTASRRVWHHDQHSLVSPILGTRLTLWSENFIQNGFHSTTKKPRTQVSYPALSRGLDIRSKNLIYHKKGPLYKRLRTDLPKKVVTGLDSHRNYPESIICHANILITIEDRGWRELGAEVILDSDGQKIVVKLAGATKFSYKAHQVLQPGIPNRYTHAMMWKGGKDWTLEFTDRNQWFLFKMLHGKCFNQNIRAASVKNIPIPGVRLINDEDEVFTGVPFVRNPSKYYQLVGTEVETALDPSHVLYDMSSDDEKWISKYRESTTSEVTDDMFERVMDMFEKVAYVKQCDCLNDDEIVEIMEDFGSLDIIKDIHKLWHEKRRKKGMPLIRQYQPPLWEYYQQQLKEWELAMINLHCPANTCQEKTTAPEKPTMFAFCLKPRGLEANKGSKQRSHKKLMYAGHHGSFSRELDGLHALGRRLNPSSVGDERTFVSIPSYEGSHPTTQWLQSALSFSPREAGTAILMTRDGVDRTQYIKFFRNLSKKNGIHSTPWDSSIALSSCSEKSKRNGVFRWNSDVLDWSSSKHLQSDSTQRQQPDINEFRLRDASGAAQHASNMAKLKREKAQWLMHKADLALHKAVVAIMTADAIKTSQKDLIDDE